MACRRTFSECSQRPLEGADQRGPVGDELRVDDLAFGQLALREAVVARDDGGGEEGFDGLVVVAELG
jgi:hypothetical protein